MPHTVLQAFGGHSDGMNINTIQTAMNRTAAFDISLAVHYELIIY
jgi:hypothetical protein